VQGIQQGEWGSCFHPLKNVGTSCRQAAEPEMGKGRENKGTKEGEEGYRGEFISLEGNQRE